MKYPHVPKIKQKELVDDFSMELVVLIGKLSYLTFIVTEEDKDMIKAYKCLTKAHEHLMKILEHKRKK